MVREVPHMIVFVSREIFEFHKDYMDKTHLSFFIIKFYLTCSHNTSNANIFCTNKHIKTFFSPDLLIFSCVNYTAGLAYYFFKSKYITFPNKFR